MGTGKREGRKFKRRAEIHKIKVRKQGTYKTKRLETKVSGLFLLTRWRIGMLPLFFYLPRFSVLEIHFEGTESCKGYRQVSPETTI